MVYNDPRMGAAGGYVHANTGSLLCGTPQPLTGSVAEPQLTTIIRERDEAESERIEWVKRGERAEELYEQLKAERDSYREKAESLDWWQNNQAALCPADPSTGGWLVWNESKQGYEDFYPDLLTAINEARKATRQPATGDVKKLNTLR